LWRHLHGKTIATAHHADDQAETLLIHLLRGSGLAGLAAMSPIENNLIRPLLFAMRADIAAYVNEHSLEYREDASNADTKYLRNKIRLGLLPHLKEYNPHIVETLNATTKICRDEDALLDDMAENALAEIWLNDLNALDKHGFDELPLSLQRRAARKAYTMIMGYNRELNFEQVEALINLKDEQVVDLPGGLKAYLRGNIYFSQTLPPLPEYQETFTVIADGAWHKLADWGWEYQATAEEPSAPGNGRFSIILPAAFAQNLTWRTRRTGDSVVSGGKKGKNKLKDIFIENHIPIHKRNSWPLLLGDEEIIWVCGLWQKDLGYDRRLLIKVRICDKIQY
jgi:tRNA(Ile)-lysidine synthase